MYEDFWRIPLLCQSRESLQVIHKLCPKFFCNIVPKINLFQYKIRSFSCCCLVTKSYLTLVILWAASCQPPLPSQSLLIFMSMELVMLSNHLILCHLLLLPLIFPSIRVFPSESALRSSWPKYWSFCFSISPSNEYSGLIFFRID